MNIVVNASDFLNDFYNTLTKEQKSSSYGKSLKAICSIQREKEIEEYSKIIQKEKDKNKEKEYYNYDNNHNQTSVYDSEMATFLLNNINDYDKLYEYSINIGKNCKFAYNENNDVIKISDLLVNNIGVLSVSEIWKFYYEVVYKL